MLKIALAATSALSFLLLATLAVILTAGRVSFGPEEEAPPPPPPPPAELAPHEQLRELSETKSKFINDLIAALHTRELELARREDAVAAREQKVLLREAVFEEVGKKFDSLKVELEAQQTRLEEDIASTGQQSRANVQLIAEMAAKMEPESAVEMLSEMDPNVVALMLTMLDERPAAKILDAAAQGGKEGAAVAAKWAEAIQRLKAEGMQP